MLLLIIGTFWGVAHIPAPPTAQPFMGVGPRIQFAKRRKIKITERDILRTRKRRVVVVDAKPQPVILVAGVPLALPTAQEPVRYPVGESAPIAIAPKPYTPPKQAAFTAPAPWTPEPEPEPHWLSDDDLDTLIYALA